MNEKRQSLETSRIPPCFLASKTVRIPLPLTRHKEIREENALGKNMILLALNILVLIQHPSRHIQLAVKMQKTKLGTKHRNLANVY